MTTQFDINAVVDEWRRVREQRLELEKLAKKITEGPEVELRGQILMYLDTQGLKGAKVNGGTISRRITTHMQVDDIEAACKYMLENMGVSLLENKPLADCLILQKTALKSAVTDIVKQSLGITDDEDLTEEQFNNEAKKLGMKIVSKTDISFTSK